MEKSLFQQEAERLRPKLLATAHRIVGDDAEDIVQDAMLKLWLMHEQLVIPIDRLATVIVRNLSLNSLRRQRPTISLAEADIGDLAQDIEHATRIERVMHIIETLPSTQQIILQLRHFDEMEYHDIAKLTASTEAAVRKALSRARQEIRRQYIKENE